MHLKAGDHIKVDCKTCAGLFVFEHHGIVSAVPGSVPSRDTLLSDIRVVHFSLPPEGGNEENRVVETSLDYFLRDGSDARLVHPADDPAFEPDVVVARALSQLGKTRYDIGFKNCEHFATWCVHGSAFSRQVYQYGVGFAVAAVVCGIVAAVLIPASRHAW